MAEKLIGNLITGDHPPPEKARALKDQLKVPVSIGAVLLLIGGLLWEFINYSEESRVRSFMETVADARYDAAYSMWDSDDRYQMHDFLLDWGEEGYYASGSMDFDICDSNSSGTAVVVYTRIDGGPPLAMLVDKETGLISYSPENKYRGRRISRFAGCL